ncbi:uncharacterized protein STEHIDRAFT_119719 [Stereum hirsutum FP-91666 SS1]|uniref:uncharacterized protein n=1 Tax=Stereum hirsutum (strain FP-91666) TaxID=721885 RepID=UPI000440A2ED|nr:uncharacterized protein STEHIDRAFT_119719 [Stereum hirsutum FP-91666 SS1]EIM88941.1 hypothetical protein STEHIDRAFT_119719 [Stereum hirsutum FP-91666 SS1]
MEERSKRMDMYLRSVEGVTQGDSDDSPGEGAWGSLGGESHIRLPVLVRCMDDLASLLSVLTENRWIIGADLDHIPIQARELVPNLKYYAEDLKAFHGDIFGVNDVPYLIETTSRLSALLETITRDLASAAEAVSASKKGMETVQLNRFAGASFFSSVTATVIQFSFQQTEGLQWKVVNLFWIMSLALSIGAAAAAFAGTVRRDARYHGIALSLVHFWGEQPPVLTYWSVVCFVVGLVTFAWASGQSLALKLILSIFACVWGTGILGVMAIIIHWNYATRAGPAIRDFMSHFILRSIRSSHPEEDNKLELESNLSLPGSLRA